MKWVCAGMMAAAGAAADFGEKGYGGGTVFDPNPQHLWNQLNATLFLRAAEGETNRYGLAEIDIAYWSRTRHLLEGESHREAIKILDEFVATGGEALVTEPWKRAWLQNRLWQLFDWSAHVAPLGDTVEARRALELHLAPVIRRLGMSTNEIGSIASNYREAEKSGVAGLPRGLEDADGDWIGVLAEGAELTAAAHVMNGGGRSLFTVMFRHPDGRKAGTNYLESLKSIAPMWVSLKDESEHEIRWRLNREFPVVPEKGQWALVRRMSVIDGEGKIRPTRLVESIQVRTYGKRAGTNWVEFGKWQTPQEFRMSVRNAPGLTEVKSGQRDFTHFFSKGFDPFEPGARGEKWAVSAFQSETLRSCEQCHSNPGLESVNTFTRAFAAESGRETTRLAPLKAWDQEAEMAAYWKQRQFSWGLLQGIWASAARREP
jgi:hypothetical protein